MSYAPSKAHFRVEWSYFQDDRFQAAVGVFIFYDTCRFPEQRLVKSENWRGTLFVGLFTYKMEGGVDVRCVGSMSIRGRNIIYDLP